jgi:PST family polysaccharide transporter
VTSNSSKDTFARDEQSANSLTHRVVGGVLWTFSGVVVQAFLRIIVVILLARLLTPADFGLASAASIVIGLASFVTEFGLFTVIEQRPHIEERHLRTALTIFTSLGVLLGLAIAVSAPLIAGFFRMDQLAPILRVVSLAFPLAAVQQLPAALLKRNLRFRLLAGIGVVSYVLGFGGVSIVLALQGFGVWALVAGVFAQLLIAFVILQIIQPYPTRPGFDRAAFRELMYFGGGYSLGRIFVYLGEQGDNLVVGRWLGASALGLYSRAYQLLVFPVSLFGTSLKQVLLPSMAKVQHEPERLAVAYRHAITLIALVFLPLSVGAMILAPELVLALLGPKWSGVILPFQVLAAGIFFRSSYKISDSVVQATGAVYRRAGYSIAFSIMTVSGALIGQFWGVAGVAAGVLVALAVHCVLLARLSIGIVSMPWRVFGRAHLPGLLMAATTCAVAWPVTIALRNLTLMPIGVLIVSGVVTVFAQVILVYFMPRRFLGPDGQYLLEILTTYAVAKLRLPTRGTGVTEESA